MKSNIFVPKEIQVGFKKREGTYTGELAYVIYYDEKGKLRKKASWDSWRDKKIDFQKHDNIPISGFVLNKKVGGYSTGWNHRNTYARIYDPRGFEFEISIENLLYILEHTNSIKGKGLEGEFVYGWSGGDHILIPINSPDYQEIKKFNDHVYNPKRFLGKDMILGATYLHKDNKELIYIGRFDYYDYEGINKGKRYFFYDPKEEKEWTGWGANKVVTKYGTYSQINTLTKNIVDIIDENCSLEYADIRTKLEFETSFSPIDKSKEMYEYYDWEEFESLIKDKTSLWFRKTFYSGDLNVSMDIGYNIDNKKYYKKGYSMSHFSHWRDHRIEDSTKHVYFDSLRELYDEYKPKYKVKYQANGNKYKEYK